MEPENKQKTNLEKEKEELFDFIKEQNDNLEDLTKIEEIFIEPKFEYEITISHKGAKILNNYYILIT